MFEQQKSLRDATESVERDQRQLLLQAEKFKQEKKLAEELRLQEELELSKRRQDEEDALAAQQALEIQDINLRLQSLESKTKSLRASPVPISSPLRRALNNNILAASSTATASIHGAHSSSSVPASPTTAEPFQLPATAAASAVAAANTATGAVRANSSSSNNNNDHAGPGSAKCSRSPSASMARASFDFATGSAKCSRSPSSSLTRASFSEHGHGNGSNKCSRSPSSSMARGSIDYGAGPGSADVCLLRVNSNDHLDEILTARQKLSNGQEDPFSSPDWEHLAQGRKISMLNDWLRQQDPKVKAIFARKTDADIIVTMNRLMRQEQTRNKSPRPLERQSFQQKLEAFRTAEAAERTSPLSARFRSIKFVNRTAETYTSTPTFLPSTIEDRLWNKALRASFVHMIRRDCEGSLAQHELKEVRRKLVIIGDCVIKSLLFWWFV